MHQSADEIGEDESGIFVKAGPQKFRAQRVFDSRPPVFQEDSGNNIHIHQSFIGWVIETKAEMIDPNTMDFMDFDVDQNGGTQFVYVLPYSSNTALVELTRFSSDKITETEASRLLEKYILGRFGSFTVKSVEKGCIPMSNTKIESINFPGLSQLGARNYSIKPSTGYALKNMHNQACLIAEKLASSDGKILDSLNNSHAKITSGRFAFYDALLLWILQKNPEFGKLIFTKLFQHTRFPKVLQFLDQKSGIISELKIFSTLPLKPFVLALIHQSSRILQPFILLCISLMLIAAGTGTDAQYYSGSILLHCRDVFSRYTARCSRSFVGKREVE